MLFDKLGFPPHEGLPGIDGAPTIDGFVEPEPGITPPPPGLEAGYVNGGRFIYGGNSGIPLGVIDCVRDNALPRIYVGIVTHFNLSFNDNDFVMIVLRPGGPAGNAADDLRIHIKPVSSNADGAVPATTTPPQPGDSTSPAVRTNRDPAFATTFYSRDTSVNPPRVWKSRAQPAGFGVKVRSTKSGTARCWSVELQIPTDGGGNWVALQSSFGLYLDVGRPFLMNGNGYIDQTPWPYDPLAAAANAVTDDPHYPYSADFLDNWDVPAAGASSGIGTGILVTDQASNPAKGVKFQAEANGIGVLSGSTITSNLDTTVGDPANTLVARLLNTAEADAADVRATFHVADFGCMGPFGYGATWATVPAVPNPTNPKTITGTPSGTTPVAQDITLDWTITQTDHDNLRNWDHTCMWVELDSTAPAGAAVNIIESSVRRNLVYVGMSEAEVDANIEGPSYGPSLTGDGMHDLILHVASIPIPRIKTDPRRDVSPADRYYAQTFGPLLAGHVVETPGSKETVGWVSVVNAYQVTEKVLTIDGRKHKVVVGGGSYALVGEHVLEPGETAANIDIAHTLEGGGVVHHGGGLYQVSVPEHGAVKFKNRLKTVRTDVAGTGADGKGCLGLLLPFLAWLKKLFS